MEWWWGVVEAEECGVEAAAPWEQGVSRGMASGLATCAGCLSSWRVGGMWGAGVVVKWVLVGWWECWWCSGSKQWLVVEVAVE